MTKKETKALINAILLAAAVITYFTMRIIPHQDLHLRGVGLHRVGVAETYYVTRVIDGDTIKLSNGEHVRLIGIDTPEARYNEKALRDSRRSKQDLNVIFAMGKEASKFTKDLAQGKMVKLEFDVEKRDRYGRLLAYVYLEDGTFVNARVVEEGYAQVLTIPPDVKYADLFSKLQEKARVANKGLWREVKSKTLF